jgi:phosphomannomutase
MHKHFHRARQSTSLWIRCGKIRAHKLERCVKLAPKFGTSGLRGLVSELSDALCARYVQAFLQVCGSGRTVLIARDLRPSSPRISAAVAAGAAQAGFRVVDCGEVPTPALALAALGQAAPSVMITGSHIPADRNGLKFYSARGEITKTQELEISRLADRISERTLPVPTVETDAAIGRNYLERYLSCFGPQALGGFRIGVYEHSSVARDIRLAAVRGLGGTAVPLGRSDSFIPVDTEAVDPATRQSLRTWTATHHLDAVISADGDGDRPLLSDEKGEVVPGDILGTLTAIWLGADTVVTPVSSNTLVESCGVFDRVLRTRIGSPFVIAEMEKAARTRCRPVGFEANGGFLLGFDAEHCGRPLPHLMTRDSLLPLLAPLATARHKRLALGALVATLPTRFTASDRMENTPTAASMALIGSLADDKETRANMFADFGPEAAIDLTDGLRVTFADGLIVHLRPSGNAPELRCYAEADTAQKALAAMRHALGLVQMRLSMTS